MVKFLNVAEKPSVAKQIVSILSQGSQVDRLQAPSKFNPVSGFKCQVNGAPAEMIFTSVRGHLMEIDFAPEYENWLAYPPSALLVAPIIQRVPADNKDLATTLTKYARGCDGLILWLDCDREGEGIAFEVINVVQSVKPRISIQRATFSAVTPQDVHHAMATLHPPDAALAHAVDARQELDLRLGVSLTRLMTLRFKRAFNMPTKVISYGPCQFPTLGFVVSRYIAIQGFVPENFFQLNLSIQHENESVPFAWKRHRVFDRLFAMLVYQRCLLNPAVRVQRVEDKPTRRRRPVPMNTIAMTKYASRLLKFPAHETMAVAEALYNRGVLSYPRTETDSFPKSMNPQTLVAEQTRSSVWGSYAQRLMDGAYEAPRRGTNDDAAHPPIHPVKAIDSSSCQSAREWELYQMITCHFLAVCSQDAQAKESYIEVAVDCEVFSTKGIIIADPGYLEIWGRYEPWHQKTLPALRVGSIMSPERLTLDAGQTSPPQLLSEVELISRMDKYGVGTDATMHEHIRTIQTRQYVERLTLGGCDRFKPTVLGLALFAGYKRCCKELIKPELRAETEKSIASIANGQARKDAVVKDLVDQYIQLFHAVGSNLRAMEDVLARHFARASV